MPYEAERRIILSHQRLVADVRKRVTTFAVNQYKGLGSWRDADIDRFVARVVPTVEAGQVKTAQLTQSYLAAMARVAGFKPPTVPKTDYNALRGVALDEVYRRPAVATYTALSQGQSLTDAIEMGATRVDQLVAMDMQMANVRSAFDFVSSDDNIVGWQRVLSPGENCALCAIASTQRYTTQDLMPIHDRCGCDVSPIYGSRDPGQVINTERLDEIQGLLQEQGIEYERGGFKTDRSIRVDMHGEYGPVLSWQGQNFTGPQDIAAPLPDSVWVSSSGKAYPLVK
jgi:hypothetical protein